ncbi:5-hydroxytryptamine receptor 1E-like isoform X2 [Anguilla rostrata]|uniref:5-hydroxytryptamine receptor 1E-like n=2 Tax=Anguilla TaxID=7935 RepID=UPI0015B012F2|nr:5-hydroxytryptamine receptor 1E-like [Anguilla anguilla]XP_035263329.1 5-hydroxytryptamine receptor 1E-like [Anguilla anguilla]XP_035263331.1 5-hydroxytryptamine receptor 1E-like [Anguilla anguilla]
MGWLVADSPGAANVTGSKTGSAMAAEKVAVVVCLGTLTLLTTILNGGVIAAICTTKKLHLPANYLICSLAVTDFLVAILVMPPSILYVATETWPLGPAICEAWLSLDMTCCTCSILHLCAIALDRYWAITNAVEYTYKRTARRAAVMVAAVWAISALISVPPLFWRRGHGNPGNHTDCMITHDHVGYTLYSTVGAFYGPLVLILVLYCRIYAAAKALYKKRGSTLQQGAAGRLDSQNSFGHCRSVHAFCVPELSTSDPGPEMERLDDVIVSGPAEGGMGGARERARIRLSRERKAARTLGLILGAFVLCWLPFFIKELLVGLKLLRDSESMLLSNALTWLGYVNSLINPLIYTSFNEDFKHAFKMLLKCKGHP